MRLSNLWPKFRDAALCALGIFVSAFCAYQIYSAAADGSVMFFSRSADRGWMTFQSNPSSYVFWVIMYLIFGALGLAAFFVWIFSFFPMRGRWRSRQFLDDAIRQKPQER
jgi:hypothetical protein